MPLIVQRLIPHVDWVEHDKTKKRYLVSATDVFRNVFSVKRKDGKILLRLNPEEWSKCSKSAPWGTVARGSLDDEGH